MQDEVLIPNGQLPFTGNVFVRTVTYHYVGCVRKIVGRFLVLDDASWVADSGRFSTALADGQLSEVERYPGQVAVHIESIVDISPWNHALPTETV